MNEQTSLFGDTEQGNIPLPCPFCGSIERLDLQLRQAPNHKTRYGKYDAAIYCRKCYAYGPRIKSEHLALPEIDSRNESPRLRFNRAMREAAIQAWNRRLQ